MSLAKYVMYSLIELPYFLSTMLILDDELCNCSCRSGCSRRASGQAGMLRPGQRKLCKGLFQVLGHGTGGSTMAVAVCAWDVETV